MAKWNVGNTNNNIPESVCSKPCPMGQIKNFEVSVNSNLQYNLLWDQREHQYVNWCSSVLSSHLQYQYWSAMSPDVDGLLLDLCPLSGGFHRGQRGSLFEVSSRWSEILEIISSKTTTYIRICVQLFQRHLHCHPTGHHLLAQSLGLLPSASLFSGHHPHSGGRNLKTTKVEKLSDIIHLCSFFRLDWLIHSYLSY